MKMKLYNLIIVLLLSFTALGQKNEIVSKWTNGFEFFSAEKYNESLIVFSGGNLHEGGCQFTLKVLGDMEYTIIGNSPDNDFEPCIGKKGYPVRMKTFDKQKILAVYDSKDKLQEVLMELNISFEKMVIQNKINYQLAGKYKDEKGKQYLFYPNKLKAEGFSNQQDYKFEYEYDFPIEVLTFKNQSFYYEISKNDLIIYKAQKDADGSWEKTEKLMKLTKKEWLNSTNRPDLKGKYPFVSSEIMTKDILGNFDKKELRLMRNEIFARHGYIFKTAEMKAYFESQDWYSGLYDDVKDKLTDLEKLNIELITMQENK